MKKLIKIIVILFAIIAAGIVATLAFVMSSNTQTKFANNMLAEKMAGSSVGEIGIGFSSASVKNIKIPFEGGEFSAEQIDASYALLPILQKTIEVKEFTLANAKIKMLKKADTSESTTPSESAVQTYSSAETASSTPVAEPTKDSEFSIPEWAFKLGKTEINLEVETLEKDIIKISVSGQNLETNKKLMPVSGNFKVQVLSESEKLKESCSFEFDLKPEGGKLSLKALAKIAEESVLKMTGTFSENYSDSDVELSIEANNATLKNLPIKKLPEFSAQVYAAAKIENFGKKIDAKIMSKNSFSELEVFMNELKGLGKFSIEIDSEISKNENTLSIKKAKAAIAEKSSVLLSMEAPKPFDINLEKPESTAGDGLFSITLNGLPFRIVNMFLGDLKLSGKDIAGRMELSVLKNGDIKLKSLSPFTLMNFGMEKAGAKIISGLNSKIGVDLTCFKNTDAEVKLDAKISDGIENESLNILAKIFREAKNGNCKGSVEMLGSFKPLISKTDAPASLEKMTSNSSINFETKGSLIKLNTLSLLIGEGSVAELINIKTLCPIEYELETKKFTHSKKTFLSAKIKEFPFGIISPFAAGAEAKNLSLNADVSEKEKGYSVSGNFDVSALGFAKNGEKLLQNINISSEYSVDISNQNLNAALSNLMISELSSPIGKAEVRVKFDMEKTSLKLFTFESSLALVQLLRQPALQNFSNLSSGNGALKLEYAENKADISVELANITAVGIKEKVNTLQVKIKAEHSDNFSKISSTSDILMRSTRGDSDAKIHFAIALDDIAAKINSKLLVMDDITVLAQAFKPSTKPAETQTPQNDVAGKNDDSALYAKKNYARPSLEKESAVSANTTPDEKALWDFGKSFSFEAKIDKIKNKNSNLIEDLAASLLVNKNQVALKNLSAKLLESPLSMSAVLDFAAGQKLPYTFKTSKVELKNFDVEKLMSEFGNQMIDGLFSVAGELRGVGANLNHLATRICGDLSIKGSGGTIKLLDKNSDAGKKATVASGIARIGGALLGGKVNEVAITADLIDLFVEMKYNSADVEVTRSEENMNIVVKKLEFNTPEILISSKNGTVFYDETIPFMANKIDLKIDMLVGENTSALKLLQKVNFCKTTSPNFPERYNGPSFIINGTLEQPENNLNDILTKAAVGGISRALSR